jgi:hypothetical protein
MPNKSESKIKFVMPDLGSIGGLAAGAFNSDLQAVFDAAGRFGLDVPATVHSSADAVAIAQAVVTAIEAEIPEPSADKVQEIRNLVSYNNRHADELALARQARLDAAIVLVRVCQEAVPMLEPQFIELFNAKVAAINPLLATIERFRSVAANFVMEGNQANRYNQDAILADSDGSKAFRSASLLSADMFILANVRKAMAYLVSPPAQLVHEQPELVAASRLLRIEPGFDARALAAAMRARGLEHWAALEMTAGVSVAWQTVADQEALQRRLLPVARAYGE